MNISSFVFGDKQGKKWFEVRFLNLVLLSVRGKIPQERTLAFYNNFYFILFFYNTDVLYHWRTGLILLLEKLDFRCGSSKCANKQKDAFRLEQRKSVSQLLLIWHEGCRRLTASTANKEIFKLRKYTNQRAFITEFPADMIEYFTSIRVWSGKVR